MEQPRASTPSAAALLQGIALAAVLVPAIDAALLPWSALGVGRALLAFPTAFAELHGALLGRFYPVLVSFALMAGLAYLRAANPEWRWITGLLGTVVVAIVAYLYLILVSYPPFAGYVPLLALFVGLAAVAAYAIVRPQRWVGASCLAAGAVVSACNYTLYVDRYPALHVSVLGACLLLFALGVAIDHRLRARGRRALWIATAAMWLVAGGFRLVSPSSAVAAIVERDSMLSMSQFVDLGEVDRDSRIAYEPVCIDPPEPMPIDQALEVFARDSGLPDVAIDASLNVLVIVVDTLRFDQTSLADPALGTTPHLVALRDASALDFSAAYAPSPGTFQSIAGLFALSPVSFAPLTLDKQRPWRGQLPSTVVTAAEAYQQAGRRTFAVVHSGLGLCRGCTQGFEQQHVARDGTQPDLDAEIASAAIEQLDAAAKQPFFGFVFFVSPHEPYLDRDASSAGDIARYRSEIRYADQQLGRVLDHLKTSGLLDHTVVVVTSDHGEEFLEHKMRYHMLQVYRESLQVPLLVRVPGVAGQTIDRPTSIAYVLPWLMVRAEPQVRERATRAIADQFAPLMIATGGAVVAEMVAPVRMLATLIAGRHKLNYDLRAKRRQVFDLFADPEEQRPSADSSLSSALDGYLQLRACKKQYSFVNGGGSR